MGHAEHFLRRLDRVCDAHVELALALYRDEALLAEVLSRAALPDGAERVAISLADPIDGPFVIVTREGRFVTCLGPAMRVSDLPVVTRERLDSAAARVQRMRDELDRVRTLRESGAEGQAALAFRRMQQQGPRFAREDAAVLLRAQPLLEHACLERLLALRLIVREHVDSLALLRLDAPRKLKSAERDYLLAFGDGVWSMAHLIVMLASPTMRRTFAEMERVEASASGLERESVAHMLALASFDWGTALHVIRALWFLARNGKSAIAAVKQFNVRATLPFRLYRELGLAAIALGSDRLRAEATKALTVRETELSDGWESAVERTAAVIGGRARDMIEDPRDDERGYLSLSRHFAAGLALGKPNPTLDEAAFVPDEVARLAWVAQPVSLYDLKAIELFGVAVQGLPTLVRGSAEELFLPAEWARRLVPERGVEDVAYWFSKYAEARFLTPMRATRRVEVKVGRNEPCPCGSGKKYKRCCGAT